MKNNVFFDETNGTTTTNANHIANLAKESYMTIESELEHMRFHKQVASLLDSDYEKTIFNGVGDISEVPSKLEQVAKLKSIIAWLREAIKEKELLIREAKARNEEEIANIIGIELPERPSKEAYPTFDKVLATLNIKTRNRYYWLDTLCSTIGKHIHQGGFFADARNELAHIVNNPRKIVGSGHETVIYTNIPTVDPQAVEVMFFKLQDTYRSTQAELNAIKHDVNEKVNAEIRRIDEEYVLATEDYNAKMRDAVSKIEQYRNNDVAAMQNLKIAIPDDLRDLYNKLSKLGKTKQNIL